MKISSKVKKAARALIFFLILILMLGGMSDVLRVKSPGRAANGFYDMKSGQCDVVMLGPSMIQQGCFPLELWKDHGITAYNLGSGNQSPIASYHFAKEAIEKQHPKLIIVECGQFRMRKTALKTSYIHYLTDNMPFFSQNRLSLIADYSKEASIKTEDTIGLFVPLTLYHSNWKKLTKKYFTEDVKNKTCGARISTKIDSQVDVFGEVEVNPSFELPDRSSRYLEKLMDLCDETGTELLLIMMPIPGATPYIGFGSFKRRYNTMEAIKRIASERGYNAVNLLASYDELGIDPQHDTKDGQHLNYWGGVKFTSWLGSYLKENYALEDHRDDPGYKAYQDAYEIYRDYIDSKLGDTEADAEAEAEEDEI